MSEAMAEWRRTDSRCAGLLLVGLRDLRAGAGWGVIDAVGLPKAPWFALARASRPVGLLLTDEGLNGLALHLVNDGDSDVVGQVDVEVYSADHRIDQASGAAKVPARGGVRLAAEDLFDGFRDLTYAYRFGPRTTEVVVARLLGEDGATLAAATFLPDGPGRPVQAEVGLQATLHPVDEEAWSLSVSTRRFAQFVSVDIPGFRLDDSWFHLEPGGTAVLGLHRVGSGSRPTPRARSEPSIRRRWSGSRPRATGAPPKGGPLGGAGARQTHGVGVGAGPRWVMAPNR